MKDEYFLHGDVHIIRVAKLPKEMEEEVGNRVLEWGEVTNHSHALSSGEAKIYRATDGRRFLRVVSPSDLTHEEHHTRTIQPGDYEIRRTRETDHMSGVTRLVAD